MKRLGLAARLLLLAGIALILWGVLMPGEERLVRESLPLETHVTVLTSDAEGRVIAATQSDGLWRHTGGTWTPLELDLGGRLVLALRGDPARHPIGTATGLLADAGPPLPSSIRVSDLLETPAGLVVATPDGIWVRSVETWQRALAGTPVYRLAAQPVGERLLLHAGTIGAGVYSAWSDAPTASWHPKRRGLPEGVKVLSFATSACGRLLARTDQGLYAQDHPESDWRKLALWPEARRVLSLALGSATESKGQRLWIGSDAGLFAADLREPSSGLELAGAARRVEVLWEPLEAGVSWIVPSADGLMISAGPVYRLRDTRPPGWWRFVLGGLVLILAATGVWLAGDWKLAADS